MYLIFNIYQDSDRS